MATTKKATKKTANKRATKSALRKPQVRVLQTLAKSAEALNRSEIGAKAKVDVASLRLRNGTREFDFLPGAAAACCFSGSHPLNCPPVPTKLASADCLCADRVAQL